ncbi:hypothetical protein MMC30_005303 [Trapelia coarctata]|nr:hypothetical protein [Trapelia coarctata]
MERSAEAQVQRCSHDDNSITAGTTADMNTDIMKKMADGHIHQCANGYVEVVNGAKATLDIAEQQPTQLKNQPNSHDDDIINTTAEGTVEMNIDILERLTDIHKQPSENDHLDVANGVDATLVTLEREPTKLRAEPYSLDDIVNTTTDSGMKITSNYMEQHPTELQTQSYSHDDVDATTVEIEITSDVMEQRPIELQTETYSHNDIDDTTTGGGVDISSEMMEQHPTGFQTISHSRDDVESTTANASVDIIDMNTDIVERQVKIKKHAPTEVDIVEMITDARTYHGIREYVNFSTASSDQPWLALPELPTAGEVGSFVGDRPATLEYKLQPNKIDGPWKDKEEYLRSHYELLREDAVAPLRDVVQEFHAKPNMMERDSQEHAAIYEKVYIKGMTFAQQGVAVRVGFSLRRAEKLIRWEQSKRLMSGTIVALTHAKDKFDTICKIAVVAARPLTYLYTNPPTIELYFNSVDELELDPQQEWIMIESRAGYYEANRHTLLALQKMSTEKFPLAEHIVDLATTVQAPEYVTEEPWKELSPALTNQNQYFGINVIEDWPEFPEPNLDESQLAALRRILIKRLAVVQGPPGTGKTHVSVVALKIMRGNMSDADPPIIVTAQTNHALDQLLRHISEFEPNFIRLGGRTADKVLIKPRTLFEVRQASSRSKNSAVGPAMQKRNALSTEIRKMLDPLINGTEPLTAELLHSYGLLSQAQLDSLINYAAKGTSIPITGVPGLIAMWMEDYLIPAIVDRYDDYANLELEEADLAFEQLKDVEAESGSGSSDDDAFELLRGDFVALAEPWTGHWGQINDKKIEELLRTRQDLWRIPAQYRGSVYCYLQRKFKEILCTKVRTACSAYMRLCQNLKVAKWERDLMYLRDTKIVGMTTTGLSKYRALITSLNPKVVLIEEAAETIEANVTAACFESLQHLILVGDHQQLRGHCAVQELEGHPWNLAVSLFERLVRNNFEYSQLTRQRRMRPEIRQIINPIYPKLEDHPCVESREDVPGMGGINSWFHSHQWYESNDNHMSKRNLEEAEMVVGLFDHLVHNGMEVKDITVLTFYNGQRKRILDFLKRHRNFQGNYEFKVVTVDSYQGEENEVVLLSLVRNNPSEIGFLSIANRVCVALSRARRGFYIFGNHKLLFRVNKLWRDVVKVLSKEPSRVGEFLPITCTNHGQRVHLYTASDWRGVNGGCASRCAGVLACGHSCPSTCHPFPHAHIKCQKKCLKIMAGCGHRCNELCSVQSCRCQCRKNATVPRVPFQCLTDDPFLTQAGPSSQAPKNSYGSAFPKLGSSTPASAAEGKAWQLPKQTLAPRSSAATLPTASKTRTTSDPMGVHTPRHRYRHEVSAQVQAWGDFAAGGHVEADEKIKVALMEKVAQQEKNREVEKRMRADQENEELLFGLDEAARPDESAVGGGGELEPAHTDVTAANGEAEAEGDLLQLDMDMSTPRRGGRQADLLDLEATPGTRVRRVETWKPASETSPTRRATATAEESLMDMANDY